MSIFGNNKSSESIAAESRRLAESELAWSNKLLTKRADIATFEVSLAELSNEPLEHGEAALARASEKLAALTSECAAIQRTIEASRLKRRSVLQELQVTRAGEFRQEAQEARAQADRLVERGDKLLGAFAEIEEIEASTVIGLCRDRLSLRTDRLRRKADDLERQAVELERSKVPDAGLVDLHEATHNDEVVAAVLAQDVVGPTINEIREWLAAVERASKRDFGDRLRRVRLVWKDGRIDTESSYVFVPSLAPKIVLDGYGLATVVRSDVEAATYRAGAAA
jgi:hypothetical protein